MMLFGNFQMCESLQGGYPPDVGLMSVEIALFQPDQAGNVGAAARLAACLDLRLHLIEPCGFPLDDQRMRRAGMDYLDLAALCRHADWPAFLRWRAGSDPPRRLVLLSTQATQRYDRFAFRAHDILLLGSESGGVPEDVRAQADQQVRIPMRPSARSLNVVVAAAMVAGYAATQTGLLDRIERERMT